MRPVLIEIDADLLFKIGWGLFALGLAWAAYGLVRAGLALARRKGAAVVGDEALNVALGAAFAVLGHFASRYVGPPVPLYSYGICLGLAVVGGWFLAVRAAVRAGLEARDARIALVVAIVFALVGARALFVATNPSAFEGAGPSAWLKLQNGGLTAWGGLIAGTLAAALYLRVRRVSFWELADAASPTLAFGIAITQIGNFLFGSDYGTVATTWPLAVRFPGTSVDLCAGSPAFRHHCACIAGRAAENVDCSGIEGNALALADGAGGFASLPVHPLPLYEAAFALLLALALALSQRRRVFAGQTFLLFALFYGVARYLFELLNADVAGSRLGLFTPNQLGSVIGVPLCLGLFFWLAHRARSAERDAPPENH